MNTPTQTTAIHTLNVWPEHSTGKWIVSYTQAGTNNEKVVGEFWHQEDADKFAAMENSLARGQAAPAPVADPRDAEVKRLREALREMLRQFESGDPGNDDGVSDCDAIVLARAALAESEGAR